MTEAGMTEFPLGDDAAGRRADHRAGRRIAVVGGGIAGLSAAWFLREAEPDARITVFEGSSRVGGKLAVGEVGGVPVDLGAESILNRRPEGVELARAVGLGDDVLHPATASASVWSRGELVPMPKGHLMGIPGDPRVLKDLLSEAGLERALAAPDTEPEPRRDDVSVGGYVAARYGREVVERLVEPLLGGVYAGHADEISLGAAIPLLVPALNSGRPVDEAVREILDKQAADPHPAPVFAGIRGGVGRLPIALAEACAEQGITIRTEAMVRELTRTPDGWRLVSGPVPAAETHDVDAVVIALPASPAARLLRETAPAASAELAGIEYASVALVTFAFRGANTLPGSGFLIPPIDGRFIKAATFSSTKWSWLRESAPDTTVLRASIGRHRQTADLQHDDAELAARALADLRTATGGGVPVLADEPIDRHVQRWGGGLPQYAVGHVDRVARIRAAVDAVPGLAVCGAAYDGLGIPACIASAKRAAASIAASPQHLTAPAPRPA